MTGGTEAGGTGIFGNACFLRLRDEEFRKGRPARTRVLTAGDAPLTETAHAHAVQFFNYGKDPAAPRSGPWFASPYDRERV